MESKPEGRDYDINQKNVHEKMFTFKSIKKSKQRIEKNPIAEPIIKNVICFSHLRWDFVFQRPQHL